MEAGVFENRPHVGLGYAVQPQMVLLDSSCTLGGGLGQGG